MKMTSAARATTSTSLPGAHSATRETAAATDRTVRLAVAALTGLTTDPLPR
ncbi:hypothetical protein ABT218_12920 [Streptomyces sp. NPDC001455]|uniref:hypothetical protein n=1 Tax=unclassified Streptomyces TaxID=2593676 RepID=UPI00331D8A60